MRVKLVEQEPKEREVVSLQLRRAGLPEKVRVNRLPKTRCEIVVKKSRLGHPDQRTTSFFLLKLIVNSREKGMVVVVEEVRRANCAKQPTRPSHVLFCTPT